MLPTFPDQLLSLIGLASPEKSSALLLGIRTFLLIFLITVIDAFHNLYGHHFEMSYRPTVWLTFAQMSSSQTYTNVGYFIVVTCVAGIQAIK